MTTADEVNALIDAAVQADARASQAHAAVIRRAYGIDDTDGAEVLLHEAHRSADIARHTAWDAVVAAAHSYMRSMQTDNPPSTKRATPVRV